MANPARLVPLPPIEGVRLAAGGAKRPPQQVQGRSPWRAFGDFPHDGKVNRVQGGAPALEEQGLPAPAKPPRGDRSPPLPIPRNEQKVASQRATPEGKNQKKGAPSPCFSAGPVLYSI